MDSNAEERTAFAADTQLTVSARRDPTWLNQATVKGAALAVVGAVVLVAPGNRDGLDVLLGALLVIWALTEWWFRVVRKATANRPASAAEAAVAFVAGLVLVFPFDLAFTIVVGVAILARGGLMLVRALRSPRAAPGRSDQIRRSALLTSTGVVVVALPETAALGVRFVLGAAALAVGLILLLAGVRVARRAATADDEALLRLDTRSTGRITEDWLKRQRLEDARRVALADTLYFEAPGAGSKQASFWVMMILATAIAAFAIVQDSTAVVIGAMLVAPLMTPIMGAAAAVVNGWRARLVASLLTVLAAVAAAIAVSWLIAAWLPSVGDLATNSQVLARTSPNLIDLCIAIAAGAAGAYATVDPRVSSGLSGVAIAVALVPPLAVVGITLEVGDYGDAGGALLLFLTNFVSIILAGVLVFVLTGFAEIPPGVEQSGQMRRVIETVLIGVLLILIPLSLTSQSIWTDAADEASAQAVVDDWIPDETDLDLVDLEVDGSTVEVVITGSESPPPVADLDEALRASLGASTQVTVRFVPSALVDE